jgi:hypothetical protein
MYFTLLLAAYRSSSRLKAMTTMPANKVKPNANQTFPISPPQQAQCRVGGRESSSGGPYPVTCGDSGDYRVPALTSLRPLALVEALVGWVAIDEGFVRSLARDPALVDNYDAIGLTQRRETMGDDQSRAATADLVQRLLDLRFGVGIHVGCGLVQDQDSGIGQ